MTVSGFDSSLDRTFDVIGEELKIWARARYSEIVDQTKGHPESPIEEALLAGMIAVNIFKPFFEFDGSESAVPRIGHAFVRLQYRIGPYRVDFLAEVRVSDRYAGAVVVECDGARWHKDAAKDAARDNYMVERGYSVLRLKAAEITGNPILAALEVVKACEKVMGDYVGRAVDKPVDGSEGEKDQQTLPGDPPEIHNENFERFKRENKGVTPDTHSTSTVNNP